MEKWKELEGLVKAGRAKALGVSNFNLAQIKVLVAQASLPPSLHQVKMGILSGDWDLARAARALGVTSWAYSSLDKGKVLADADVMEIAERYGVAPALVGFKYVTQQRYPVLTFTGDNLAEAKLDLSDEFTTLTLSEDDMARLAAKI